MTTSEYDENIDSSDSLIKMKMDIEQLQQQMSQLPTQILKNLSRNEEIKTFSTEKPNRSYEQRNEKQDFRKRPKIDFNDLETYMKITHADVLKE